MKIKQWLGWAAIAFAVWLLVKNPTGAAHLVTSVAGGLSQAATSASTFISSIGH